MPKLSPSAAPRHPHTFAGVEVLVPYTYTPGHELSENEAKFLNSTIATTIGNYHNNAVRAALKAATEVWTEAGSKGKPPTVESLGWDHQAKIDERFASFEPGVSTRSTGGGTTSTNPVAREAHKIAATKVREALTKKGYKISEFHASKDENGVSSFNKLVAAYLAKNPWVQTLAEATVAAMDEQGTDDELFSEDSISETTEAA